MSSATGRTSPFRSVMTSRMPSAAKGGRDRCSSATETGITDRGATPAIWVTVTKAPERIGVAGDWHGNTAWATRAIEKMARLLPETGPRGIVHLGDFGIWPGPGRSEGH